MGMGKVKWIVMKENKHRIHRNKPEIRYTVIKMCQKQTIPDSSSQTKELPHILATHHTNE